MSVLIRSLALAASLVMTTQTVADSTPIPAGSKVFVAPMHGFEAYLTAAILQRGVPVSIVTDKKQAEFEITGSIEAPALRVGSEGATEQATITVTQVSTGVVVFAYAAHVAHAARGKQDVAELCAEQLKRKVTSPAKPSSSETNPPPSGDSKTAATAPANPSGQTVALRLQGDLSNDFWEELRQALSTQHLPVVFVRGPSDFDLHIVVAQDEAHAVSAVALDKTGTFVTSAVHTGFTMKGVVSGCATDLAKRIAEWASLR
jgi:hypothetical protein